MGRFILYGTTACHLCELAEEMLVKLREQGTALEYEKRDIAEADELFDRYGLVIPVLVRPDGRELGWPFGPEELRNFVAG